MPALGVGAVWALEQGGSPAGRHSQSHSSAVRGSQGRDGSDLTVYTSSQQCISSCLDPSLHTPLPILPVWVFDLRRGSHPTRQAHLGTQLTSPAKAITREPQPSRPRRRETVPVVLVTARGTWLAVGVDRLLIEPAAVIARNRSSEPEGAAVLAPPLLSDIPGLPSLAMLTDSPLFIVFLYYSGMQDGRQWADG